MKVDLDQSLLKAWSVHSELYVGRTDGMGIIGHRSSESSFGANNPCLIFSNNFKGAHQEQHKILQSSRIELLEPFP